MTEARPPTFEGGLHMDGGAVAGCRMIDRHYLLSEEDVSKERPAVQWDVLRTGSGPVVIRTRRADGARPAERRRPCDARVGKGERAKRETMQHWLRTVERGRMLLGVPTPVPETDLRAARAAATGVSDERPEALRVRVLSDLAATLEVIAPFVAGLDPRAVADALAGRMHRHDQVVYALCDVTFDPEAPLAKAVSWEPELAGTLFRMATHDASILRRLVRDGRGALRAGASRWLAKLTGYGILGLSQFGTLRRTPS